MTTEILIGMADVRKQKWCAKGARDFCKRHGIDWNAFRNNRVPASVMLATGDSMAAKLVEAAQKENA